VGGRTATLRSNSPAMVEQELRAMLCVHQALRQLACDAAREHGLLPHRIRFEQVLDAARRPGSSGRIRAASRELSSSRSTRMPVNRVRQRPASASTPCAACTRRRPATPAASRSVFRRDRLTDGG
jgi:hypothetical protein